MPEEIKAYKRILVLIYLSVISLLLLTVMEIGFFFLYNAKLHPFAAILESEGELLLINNSFRFHEIFLLDITEMKQVDDEDQITHKSLEALDSSSSSSRYDSVENGKHQ